MRDGNINHIDKYLVYKRYRINKYIFALSHVQNRLHTEIKNGVRGYFKKGLLVWETKSLMFNDRKLVKLIWALGACKRERLNEFVMICIIIELHLVAAESYHCYLVWAQLKST